MMNKIASVMLTAFMFISVYTVAALPFDAFRTGEADLSGTWIGTFKTPGPSGVMELEIRHEGQEYKCELKFSDSEKKIVSTVKDFKVEGGNVSFNAEIEGALVKFEGKIEAPKMSGKLEAQEGDNKIPGEWAVTKNGEGKPKQ